MGNNSPEDEFKISQDKLREYLASSQPDPDYEILSTKSKKSNFRPTDDEFARIIEQVHGIAQSIEKIGESTVSQTERLIDLIHKMSDVLNTQTETLVDHQQTIRELQRKAKNSSTSIHVLMWLTGFSLTSLLAILATIYTANRS
jgi:hypothetical protein